MNERTLIALVVVGAVVVLKIQWRTDYANVRILHLQTHGAISVYGIVVRVEAILLATLVEVAVPVLLVPDLGKNRPFISQLSESPTLYPVFSSYLFRAWFLRMRNIPRASPTTTMMTNKVTGKI